MTIRDAMTKQIVTCTAETNLAAASALMWENDCGAVPILTETGDLAGILTDRDICIALGTRNARASELAVREVAESNPLTCASTDDISSTLEKMRLANIRYLPVVDEHGVLEGIVSQDAIIASMQRGDRETDRVNDRVSGQRVAA